MNRRGFFGLLAGIAAAPAAIATVFKPKPALPPIPELPGFHMQWVKPREAMSQIKADMERISGVPEVLRGDPLHAATDLGFSDRDVHMTVVFSRDPLTGTITLHDAFEHTSIEMEEVGLARLERGDILKVRREMMAANVYNRVFLPSRLHTDDEFARYCDRYGHSDGWKHLELPPW
jgi:hypothetical protein